MTYHINVLKDKPLVFRAGKPIPSRVLKELKESPQGEKSILPFEAEGLKVSKNEHLIPEHMKKSGKEFVALSERSTRRKVRKARKRGA